MPSFFLHLRDSGGLLKDEVGYRFANLEAAHAEAMKAAREVWADAIKTGRGRDYLDTSIVITDEQGRELRTVFFVDALPPQLRPMPGAIT